MSKVAMMRMANMQMARSLKDEFTALQDQGDGYQLSEVGIGARDNADIPKPAAFAQTLASDNPLARCIFNILGQNEVSLALLSKGASDAGAGNMAIGAFREGINAKIVKEAGRYNRSQPHAPGAAQAAKPPNPAAAAAASAPQGNEASQRSRRGSG